MIGGLGAVAIVPSGWPRVADARGSERRTVPTLFGWPWRGCGAWPPWTANGITTADNAAPSCWRSPKQRTKRYDAPSAAKLPERSRSTLLTRPGLFGSRSARAICPMIVQEIARGISPGGRLEVEVRTVEATAEVVADPRHTGAVGAGRSGGGRLYSRDRGSRYWVQPEARWIMSSSSGLGVSGPLPASAAEFRVHLARRWHRPGPGPTHRSVGCGKRTRAPPSRAEQKRLRRLSGVPRAQEPRGWGDPAQRARRIEL